jgi:hypothetical protein
MASIRYGRYILALILSAPLGFVFLLSGSNLIFLLLRNFFDIRPSRYSVDTGIFVGTVVSGGLCFICYFIVTKLYLWVREDKSADSISMDESQ